MKRLILITALLAAFPAHAGLAKWSAQADHFRDSQIANDRIILAERVRDSRIENVGGGRTHCTGSDCDRHDVRQARRDRERAEERDRRDFDRADRERERRERN